MTFTPKSLNFEFIHFGGINVRDNALKIIKSSGIKNGIERIGEVKHGFNKLARSNQLVILCYFYWKIIEAISLLFYFNSINFLL